MKRLPLLVLATLSVFGVTILDSQRPSFLDGESMARCIREDFISVDRDQRPEMLSKEWIHQSYCTQVALELARQYLHDHPNLKGQP